MDITAWIVAIFFGLVMVGPLFAEWPSAHKERKVFIVITSVVSLTIFGLVLYLWP